MSGFAAVKLTYDVVNLEFCRNETTIILIHGATSSKETWHKISKILADKTDMKVYAIDLRNHGNSPWSSDFSIDIMVKDLENFMDEHEIESAILLGHSLGGWLSMSFSLQKSSRVKMLIIEDASMKSPTDGNHKRLSTIVKYMKTIPGQIPPESDLETGKTIALDILDAYLPEAMRRDPKLRDLHSIPLIKENGVFKWKANMDVIEKCPPSITSDIKALENTHPVYGKQTLFIYGTRSIIPVLKDKDYHLKYFPQAIFTPIEGATHSVHTEYPDEFCELVTDFVLKSCH